MAAVVVADEQDAALRALVNGLRADLSVPVHKPLHWQEHVKTYQRRQYVTAALAAAEGLSITTCPWRRVRSLTVPR